MATDVTCLQCGKPYDSSVVANRFAGVCPACLAKFAADDTADVEQSPGIADPEMKPPLKLGSTFHGLEVVELIGAGGMGVVYKARQPGLDRFVALKVLAPYLSGDPEFVARFKREAKAMAALSHPGIIQVFDFGKEADLCFLVMEFVDGLSLRHLMKDRLMAPEQALKIVPKICEALEYAHSKGVIHRDIKPENILVDNEGRVRIADFGLARVLSGGAAGSPVTLSRVVMGTPGYMAPEQYQGMKVDHRADIYSLGAVFYEMLTGDLPIGRFEPPSNKVQIDVRLDEIVLKALATEPARRYQHAGDVKTAMDTVAAHPAPAVELPVIRSGLHQGRRWMRMLLGIPVTLAAIAMICYLVALMLQGDVIQLLICIPLIYGIVIWFRKVRVASATWAGVPIAPGSPGSTSARPPMIPLAVASFIVVMAGVCATAVSLFGTLKHQEGLRDGFMFGGLLVQVMGLFMSLGAMRLIRLSKRKVRGNGLALAAFLIALIAVISALLLASVAPPRPMRPSETGTLFGAFSKMVGSGAPYQWFDGQSSETKGSGMRSGTEVKADDAKVMQEWVSKVGFRDTAARHIATMTIRHDRMKGSEVQIVTWFAEVETGIDPGTVLGMKRAMPGEISMSSGRLLMGVFSHQHPEGGDLVQRLARYYSDEIARIERERGSD